jgi:secreted PhoX family phosphatase
VDTSAAAFDANAAAKAAGATPFKRPENGMFRPSTGFREFYFDETGDTNADLTANDGYGGWGTIFRLSLASSGETGTLAPIYTGNKEHAGFDNLTLLDARHLAIVEDAGDTLHTQRGKLDSGYVVDVTHDYSGASGFSVGNLARI